MMPLAGKVLSLVMCSLTTRSTVLRCRAHIVLWMGLDPAFWCPSGSSFYALKWDQQAERLGHCLFLLLTAVYLDGGMTAALDVAEVLLANTPGTVVRQALRKQRSRTTDVDLSWVPQWGKCGGNK